MAAFVSVVSATSATQSVTVAAGSDRLLVAVVLASSSTGARTATYNGVSMSVGTTANGFTQIFYMLNAPVGTATLSISGTSIARVVAAQYTGVGGFDNASTGSTSSLTMTPTAAAVIVMGVDFSGTSATPLANTNERVDDGAGDWMGDRIVAATGSVTVGVNTVTSPDSAAAWFTDAVDASGTPTAPIATASGTANTNTLASGTPTAPIATASGAASIQVAASGTPNAPIATGSGTVTIQVAASGAVTAPIATASGSESLSPVSISGAVSAILAQALGAGGIVAVPRASAHGSVGVSDPFAHVRVPGRPQGSVTED